MVCDQVVQALGQCYTDGIKTRAGRFRSLFDGNLPARVIVLEWRWLIGFCYVCYQGNGSYKCIIL